MSIATVTLVLSDVWGFHHDDVGFGWGLVMLIGMVLFWGLVIFGVMTLFAGGPGARSSNSDDPGEILKRRLAAGEISVEEYERRRSLINGEGTGGKQAGEAAPGSS